LLGFIDISRQLSKSFLITYHSILLYCVLFYLLLTNKFDLI